jgi:hypothetical protein
VASLAKGSAYDWPQAKVVRTLSTIGTFFTGNAPTVVSGPVSGDSWQLNVTLVSGNRDGPAIANMTVLLAIVSTSEAHVIDAHRRWRRCSRLDRFAANLPAPRRRNN